MIHPVQIGNRLVGPDNPCMIIAEAGVNHNGNIDSAFQLIDAAVAAGADAVKFQSFIPEEIVTPATEKANYQKKTTHGANTQLEMLRKLALTDEEHAKLKYHCTKTGILYLCTPYEKHSADMLNDLDIAAYKIASTDTTNIPFLRHLASIGRPVFLSTGMSTLAEVESAIVALGNCKKILLHCTSEYPAPFDEVNLRAMKTMEAAFTCVVGFSDHTPGIGAAPWAVARDAHVIEKHFTLSRNMEGPDHTASIEPEELKELVRIVRNVEDALGDGVKRPTASETSNKNAMQKSLVVQKTIQKGDAIHADDLVCKRPAKGLPPAWIDIIAGHTAARDIKENSFITFADINWKD